MPALAVPAAIVMPRAATPYAAPRIVVVPSITKPYVAPRVVMPTPAPAPFLPPRPAYVPPPIYYAPRPSYPPPVVTYAPPPAVVQPAKQPFWKRLFARKAAATQPATIPAPVTPTYAQPGYSQAPEMVEQAPAPAYAQPVVVDRGHADVFFELVLSLIAVGAFATTVVLLLRKS